MAGAITQLAIRSDLAQASAYKSPLAWLPPVPPLFQQEETTLLLLQAGLSNVTVIDDGPVSPPPVPPVIPNVLVIDPANAFPVPPFDENGCPFINPTQMAALATIPYSGFAAISEPDSELPPLPEGYDVMPLATGMGILVETEDTFRFRAISTSNNVPVSFFGRVQRPSGYILPFNFTLNTSAANTTFTTTPQCGKGLLLGCSASVPIGSITSGAVNAVGEIGRIQGGSFTPHTLLFSGQLDDLYPLTIDGGGIPPNSDRPALLTASTGATGSPELNLNITPNSGKRARVTRILCGVITSANAGNRIYRVQLVVNSVIYWSQFCTGIVGPSCSSVVEAATGGNSGSTEPGGGTTSTYLNCPLPESLYFYEPFTCRIHIDNDKAGDSIHSLSARYEES